VLILIRHGQSTGNAAGLLLGRSDLPLTALGRRQAAAAGAALGGVSEVRSSPLRRAVDTAMAIGKVDRVTIDERWVEVDYGELEGRSLSEVTTDVWSSWRTDPTFRPEGGESLAAVGQRVADACEELFAAGGPLRSGTEDVVVVSHVSPIKAAVGWVLGVDATVSSRLHLSNGSITRIGWGAGGPVLHTYNEVPEPRGAGGEHPGSPAAMP
jgi:probable phosphoglycerate mutase